MPSSSSSSAPLSSTSIVWLALPICSLLSQASAAAAMFALYGTKGGKELFKLALGACICLQIGTETLLLVSADQIRLFSLSPRLEMVLSVLSQLSSLLWPLLLFLSLFATKKGKNNLIAKVGLLCLLTWIASAAVGLLALHNCYYRLQSKPVPLLLHSCIDVDDWMLAQGLNLCPLILLVPSIFLASLINRANTSSPYVAPAADLQLAEAQPQPDVENAANADQQQSQPGRPPSSSAAATDGTHGTFTFGMLIVVLSEIGFKIPTEPERQTVSRRPTAYRPPEARKNTSHSMWLFLPLALLDAGLRIFGERLGAWLWKEWQHPSAADFFAGGGGDGQRWRKGGGHQQQPLAMAHQQQPFAADDDFVLISSPALASSIGHCVHFLLLGFGFALCLVIGEPKVRKLIADCRPTLMLQGRGGGAAELSSTSRIR